MAGTYLPTTTSDDNVSFVIPDGVEVYGGFAGDETERNQRSSSLFDMTVLDGNVAGGPGSPQSTDHVVRIPAGTGGTVVLDGFLIINGYADEAGGSTAAGSGAGLLIGDSTAAVSGLVRLKNLQFRDCRAAISGGAIAGFTAHQLQASDCRIASCEAGHYAGGVPIGSGGGVYLEDCGTGSVDIVLHALRVVSNKAPRGSAISFSKMSGGRFSLVNSLIARNSSEEPSAAILIDVAAPGGVGGHNRFVLSHCTISGNTGGGVEIVDSGGVTNQFNPLAIQSSIVWGNRRFIGTTPAANRDLFGGALGNLAVSVDYSNIGTPVIVIDPSSPGPPPTVYSGTKNINADPKFLAGGAGYRLALGSPCIDTADDSRLDVGMSVVDGLGDVADRDGDFITLEPIDFDLAGDDREEAAVPTVPLNLRGFDASYGNRISDMGCFERQFNSAPGGV